MRRVFVILIAVLFLSCHARADLFGGDVAVLTQILANAIQQLSKLGDIVEAGEDHLNLLKEVHKGINDSLKLLRTIDPNFDPGIYKDWKQAEEALRKLEKIYGVVIPNTPDSQVQKDTDQSVSEAITLNNSIYDYTAEIDKLGEEIKEASHAVSPGGAEKLTAQTLGVMLHVLNASLRAQATGLKLQAQAMAIDNRKDKEITRHTISNVNTFQKELKTKKATFDLPRF